MSKDCNDKVCHKTSIGGQALIEGIMMQGPKGAAMSVRLPDGTIDTEMLEVKHLRDKFKPAKLPLIRGVVNMVESLLFGFKCMEKSAEKAGIDDDIDPEEMSKLDKWISDHFGPKMMAVITGISMVLGVALAFGLFFYLPTFLVDTVDKYLFKDALADLHPLFEGIMRMVIFVAYVWIVSKIPDIKRVFMYHGAEHKSIFCYEHGLELTVENVRKQKRFHPRCGTSFIFVVLIISIFLSSALVVIFPGIDDVRIVWMGIKLLIMPLTVGVSYEFIKYAGKHENLLVKILSAPGLWMQRITTQEPTDDIIEVGIESLKAVLTDNPEDDAL
ncbi:MAG: DUF1385 domain-containing protein [Clostridia bacterium]|nr:DUF1385 domain-containing protein [Clostridia bacterium]MBP3559072.1 DUF1385 domain-containing protein [Clostridia bacterium]